MNKLIITILIIIALFWIIKDYNRRMVIVNANYQCNVAGIEEYCNYLIEREYKIDIDN